MARALVSVRRRVPSHELARYDERWRLFRDAAVGRGAKAWRFRAGAREDLYIEFLEFPVGTDPRHGSDLAEHLRLLDSIGSGKAEEWTDANIP